MPYTYKKHGEKVTVYKKGTGKVVGHTTTGKLKKYLAALHIHAKHENVNEDTAQVKASRIKAAQAKVDSLKLQLKDATADLNKIKATPVGAVTEDFSLSSYVKSLFEADDTETADADETDTTDTEDTADADTKEPAGNDDTEKQAASNQTLTVKFNMAKVKKYNNFPVIDNTGIVTGVSKDGLVVQVGDNVVLVNFEDLLS